MGEVLPLRWLGTTRRTSIRGTLETRLSIWMRDWCGTESLPALTDVETDVPTLSWHVGRCDAGSIAVGILPDGERQLGAALLGCGATGAGLLPERIGSRALRALVQSLLGTAADVTQGVRTVREVESRTGGAAFRCRLEGLSVFVHVDAPLCAVLGPAGGATSRALVSRQAAISPLTASLSVTLPLGHVPLERLASLRPGDVLQTSIRVGGLVNLAAADGTVARVGLLAADGQHRAIRIQ